MTKLEFLDKLKEKLKGLPSDDVQKSLEFYSEMIDDKVEDGLLEENAVSEIGNIEDIAKQILMDTPISKLVKQKMKPKHNMSAVEIVLLVLGSPIWLSLIVAAVAVVLSLFVSLWSIVVSLWACEASFIACAFGGFASSVIIFATGQNAYSGVIMLAAGLFLVGFSVCFFFVCKWASRGMVWLSKKITLWIKSLFLRKEKAQ